MLYPTENGTKVCNDILGGGDVGAMEAHRIVHHERCLEVAESLACKGDMCSVVCPGFAGRAVRMQMQVDDRMRVRMGQGGTGQGV